MIDFFIFFLGGISVADVIQSGSSYELILIWSFVVVWRLTNVTLDRQLIRLSMYGFVFGVSVLILSPNWGTQSPFSAEKQQVTLTATLADITYRPDSNRLILEHVHIDDGPKIPASNRILLSDYRRNVNPIPGTRLKVKARISSGAGFQNPNGFDYVSWLRKQRVVATGYLVGKPVELGMVDGYTIARFRQNISQLMTRWVPEPVVGLTEALMIGKRGRLDMSDREALHAAGVFHLMAISGLHVGLVAAWSFFIIRFMLTLIVPLSRGRDLKGAAALISLIPVLLFGALSGWSLATQRAVMMTVMILIAVAVRRRSQTVRGLMIAAIVLLVIHPDELFQAGFQLSFVAVGFLILFWRFLQNQGWLQRPENAVERETDTWYNRLLRLLVVMILTTMMVDFATSIVAVHHFNRLAPYGPLMNLWAIPWVSFVSVPLGLLSLLSYGLSETISGWLMGMAAYSLWLVGWVAELIVDWPGGWWRLPGPSAIGAILAVLALAGLIGSTKKAATTEESATEIGNTKAGVNMMRLGFLILLIIGLSWDRDGPPDDRLQVTVMDVGQAQSIIWHMPGDGWTVLDAGGPVTPRFNVGEGILSKHLWQQGSSKIKRIIISHPQWDHMAGVHRLLRNFEVESLWIGFFPEQECDKPAYQAVLTLAKQRGVEIRRVFRGDQVVSENGYQLRVHHPPKGFEGGVNDRSLVIGLKMGAVDMLFAGDVEKGAEADMLARGELKPVDIVVAPHHGSRTSSYPNTVAALQPKHVIFSTGRGNRFGFPKQAVVERWQKVGATGWNTGQDGAITIQTDGNQIWINLQNDSKEEES
ncbi:MAG: DNA internalization-related competence protein ComEC/Rec2 [Magnetococcales bacterium]|nr:DNA internalization-related competence protein ComEC/Rec2 [Magnetococcales bacterium]